MNPWATSLTIVRIQSPHHLFGPTWCSLKKRHGTSRECSRCWTSMSIREWIQARNLRCGSHSPDIPLLPPTFLRRVWRKGPAGVCGPPSTQTVVLPSSTHLRWMLEVQKKHARLPSVGGIPHKGAIETRKPALLSGGIIEGLHLKWHKKVSMEKRKAPPVRAEGQRDRA